MTIRYVLGPQRLAQNGAKKTKKLFFSHNGTELQHTTTNSYFKSKLMYLQDVRVQSCDTVTYVRT